MWERLSWLVGFSYDPHIAELLQECRADPGRQDACPVLGGLAMLVQRAEARAHNGIDGRQVTRTYEKVEVAMKAAVVHDFTAPLRIEDVQDPVAGPGEVVVKIEASGLCHTDIHAAHGDWPVKPSLPFTPGHEGVGRITQLGDGVTDRAIDDRVAIPWLGWACGACEYCLTGWETLCESQRNTGYSIDGSYAEYAKASAAFASPVPADVDPFDAAPLTCAGVTTYKAVKVSGARSSDLVVVTGIGGLGHLAVQYARIAGAIVAAVDVREAKLNLARELGADHVINAAEQDVVAEVHKLGGADAVIATAVSPQAFQQAFSCLRRGGTLVFVGLPAGGTITLPIFDTVLNGTRIVGSIVGTRVDLAEVFALHAAGRTRVIYERTKLERVNDEFKAVEEGQVPARRVFDLT